MRKLIYRFRSLFADGGLSEKSDIVTSPPELAFCWQATKQKKHEINTGKTSADLSSDSCASMAVASVAGTSLNQCFNYVFGHETSSSSSTGCLGGSLQRAPVGSPSRPCRQALPNGRRVRYRPSPAQNVPRPKIILKTCSKTC